MNARALIALGGLGLAAVLISRQSSAAIPGELEYSSSPGELPRGDPAPLLTYLGNALGEAVNSFEDAAYSLTGGALGGGARWQRDAGKPENYAYVSALSAAEDAYALPAGMLVRQCWQESRFNASAYNASGASGIMQIIPRWHPTVNAWDPYASIDYAGRFMAQLYAQFGSWALALKAYNWGAGNVNKWLAGKVSEPAETANYSRDIIADLAAAGTVIA